MTIPTPQGIADGKFVYGVDSNGTLLRKKVPVEQIDYKGRFGASAIGYTELAVQIGVAYCVVDTDAPHRVGDDVLVNSRTDPNLYMWGEIISRDTTWEPARLGIYVDDLSTYTGTITDPIIQVVARPKPGIEKDTSTTSVNPTTGGPWTFTVTAGKFFPIGGTLLIKPTTDRMIALIGEVEAYSGTSLTVSLRATNATVSQAYTSWSIALLDAPPAPIPFLGIAGMYVDTSNVASANSPVTINSGSVMDSTGRYLLTLDDPLIKYMDVDWAAGTSQGGVVRTLLTGTISNAGSAVTGSGTAFTTQLVDASDANLTDYLNSGGDDTSPHSMISLLGGDTAEVTTITNNTAMTINASSFTSAGVAYYRNGFYGNALTGDWYVTVVRKDSDGSIDVIFATATPSGEPDLPTGYTYYRIIAQLKEAGLGLQTEPHLHENMPYASLQGAFIAWNTSGLYPTLPNAIVASDSTTITRSISGGGIEWRRAALTGDVTASANSNATTIANDAVSNAKLANMGAYSLKMNNTGSSADPTDTAITALTEKTSLHNDDLVLIVDSEASNVMKKAKKSNVGGISMGKAIAAAIVFG